MVETLIAPLNELNLKKLSKTPYSETIFCTTSGNKVSAIARTDWVLIKESYEGSEFFPPVILVNAYIAVPGTVTLNVATRYNNGDYFDDEFRATELTNLALDFLMAQNEINSFGGEFIRDNLKQFEEARKTNLPPELAVQKTWVYQKIAKPKGFTEVQVTENGRVNVIFRKPNY